MRLNHLILIGATVTVTLLFVALQVPAGPLQTGDDPVATVIQVDAGLAPDHPGNVLARATSPGSRAADEAVARGQALLAAGSLSDALAVLAPGTPAPAAPEPLDLVEEATALAAESGHPLSAAETARLQADAAALPEDLRGELAHLVRGVREGARLADEAQAGVAPGDRVALHALAPRALQALRDPHLPEGERARVLADHAQLAANVDLARMELAGRTVAAAVDRFAAATGGFTMPASWSGDMLLDVAGLLLVGGPGVTEYSGFNVLVVDLGGDDVYTDTAGGVPPGAPYPVSIVIDLQGNDRYHSPTKQDAPYLQSFVQGAAYLGVGILADLGGDDHYASGITLNAPSGDATYTLLASQGFGLLGVGILADASGDDLYASLIDLQAPRGSATYLASLVQGSAWSGVGLLAEGGGHDRYASGNTVVSTAADSSANAILATSHCQGTALALGAAALADGALMLPLASAGVLGGNLPLAGDDHYNSRNTVRSDSLASTFGLKSIAQQMSTACQGASVSTLSASLVATPAAGPAAFGLLADVVGQDLYNSGNLIRGLTRDPSDEVPCVACHTAADLTVKLNGGASGSLDTMVEALVPPLALAGALVDGAGGDSYVSDNDIIAHGNGGLRPVPEASATLGVTRSLGYGGRDGGLPDLTSPAGSVAPECKGLGGGAIAIDGAPCGLPPLLCLAGPEPVEREDDGTGGAPGREGSAAVAAGCAIGVLADLGGADRYVSDNRLDAAFAESNQARLAGDLTLGAALPGGIGAAVDGLNGGLVVAAAGDTRYCAVLGIPCRTSRSIGDGQEGNDRYYTGNVLPVAQERTWSLVQVARSYGAARLGAALFADVNLPPGSGAFTAATPGTLALAVAKAALAWSSADLYTSHNACDMLTSDLNHGTAHLAIGAFVDVGGDDQYEQNPACGALPPTRGMAHPDTTPAIAVFLDVSGADAYPAGGTAWDGGIWLLGLLGIGADVNVP